MSSKAYFGLGWPLIVNIILCLVFGWLFACIERFVRGKILWGILAIILCPIFEIVDLISLIVNGNTIKWLI